jgi:hypothetical protein
MRLQLFHAPNFSTRPQLFQLFSAQYTDLSNASNTWTDLVSTNGTGDVVAANDPAVGVTRYYRVKRQPAP